MQRLDDGPTARGRLLCLVLALVASSAKPDACIAAEPPPPEIEVRVAADRTNGLYELDAPATFRVEVQAGGVPVTAGVVQVTLTLDGGKRIAAQELSLARLPSTVTATLDEPGFLRCQAVYTTGRAHYGYGAAGYAPERIRSVAEPPADFDAFWEQGRRALAEIAVNPRMLPMPEHTNADQASSMIDFSTGEDSRLYGFLSVPRGRWKPPFPAMVTITSAGVGKPRAPSGWARAHGVLCLSMSVHDLDLRLSREEYAKLAKGSLLRYAHRGAPDREAYFFRKVILGLDRAVTWLAARPDFDGKHLVCFGSSQGGGLALALAGFSPDITAVCAIVPALCDHAGPLLDRDAGWPRLYSILDEAERPEMYRMAAYFDTVNWCRRIRVPAIVGVGFIDTCCVPSSVYCAFNKIRPPKRIFPGPDTAHGTPPEMGRRMDPWMLGKLGIRDELAP